MDDTPPAIVMRDARARERKQKAAATAND
jgi:hypothetical protein